MHLKLKRTPGLFLLGFMASGKSTTGRLLADQLGWQFEDIDACIEQEHRQSVREIFESEGEPAFRAMEAAAIRQIVTKIQSGHPRVVALGGGAFIQAAIRQLIETNGVSVWLDCSLHRVAQRLEGDRNRPLAQNGVAELYRTRRDTYAGADFRVDADCDEPENIVRQILTLPIF